jgi:hypothetical protein
MPTQLSSIIKTITPEPLECELVVFNGVTIRLEFIRDWNGKFAHTLRVSNFDTNELLAENPWPGGMGCAIVDGGVIHVFGNTNWTNVDNKIIRSTLDANFAPSMPVDALLTNYPGGYKFYNTGITADPNGYRMVVETSLGTWFARATSVAGPWTFHGGQVGGSYYSGSPTLHYLPAAGSEPAHHLVTYLKETGGVFYMAGLKSTNNCFTFSATPYDLLVPGVREGNNASDATFVERNGEVVGCWLDGNQTTLANYREFKFAGTLAQLSAGLGWAPPA